MKLTLGFSPCPNDTFIFDAMVNGKIDNKGYEFETHLEDIQTLNQWASEGRLDISKLSFPALFQNTDKYEMLSSGAALGKGVGPLLIAKSMVNVPDIEHSRIAIPGENTTANFLLNFAFPMAKNKIPMLFSEIEDAVLMEKVDLGVIIHENRFTYQRKHLIKICDLGEIWEERQHLPIPLGCIALRKSLQQGDDKRKRIRDDISQLIRDSLNYARQSYPEISDYTRNNAQEMEDDVMRNHIELYVNDHTSSLGADGERAIHELQKLYRLQQ